MLTKEQNARGQGRLVIRYPARKLKGKEPGEGGGGGACQYFTLETLLIHTCNADRRDRSFGPPQNGIASYAYEEASYLIQSLHSPLPPVLQPAGQPLLPPVDTLLAERLPQRKTKTMSSPYTVQPRKNGWE